MHLAVLLSIAEVSLSARINSVACDDLRLYYMNCALNYESLQCVLLGLLCLAFKVSAIGLPEYVLMMTRSLAIRMIKCKPVVRQSVT